VIGGNLNSRNRRRQGYVGQEKAQKAQKITANGHELTRSSDRTTADERGYTQMGEGWDVKSER
jgi:hypothetical protein